MCYPRLTSCDEVFRTYKGLIKGCFISPLRNAFAYEAMISTVIKAISYVKLYSWDAFWLESDYALWLNCFLIVLLRFLAFASSVVLCLAHIASINFRVSHMFHEDNMVADYLSKMVISLSKPSWSFILPKDLDLISWIYLVFVWFSCFFFLRFCFPFIFYVLFFIF